MGRCFFRIGKKLKTDQHFCKLGKIWIYIKQCTSSFFMDEHPQTAWALFSTIFAYLPRTWALRGTSWNLLWFVIPALLFRHGVPWTFFRVTASVDNLVSSMSGKELVSSSKHLVIPWNFENFGFLMRRCESNVMDSMDYILTCEEDIFLGLVAAPCLGLVSSDWRISRVWHVTEASNQPRIWSKQWHTSIRRAWFIVTSNLRLGSSWWNNGRDHLGTVWSKKTS